MADEEGKARTRMVVEEVSPVITEKVIEVEKVEKVLEEEGHEAKILTEAASTTDTSDIIPVKKSPSIILTIIIPGIFLLGALLGGIIYYEKVVNKDVAPSPIDTIAPSATSTPSASPSATLDLTKYTIVVQNGSGTAGEAGKVKDLLTTAGFKVGTTGNAATYDFTKTVIKTKKTVEADYVAKLTTALGKTYEVDSTVISLADTSKDSVIVIVGTSKAK